jgi:hypothetical protein
VPWCDTCDRFYNPNSVDPDGTCRTCGARLADPQPPATATATADADVGTPWHFKLMVAGVVAYLVWRAIQGIDWLLG